MTTATIAVVTEDGEEIQLPTRYEVCGRCHGTGTHVNPAIDGHGISAEEMYELGDEFIEDYCRGVYDIRCEECHGERVVAVLDEERCTPEQVAAYERHLHEEWVYQQECAMERRMGA